MLKNIKQIWIPLISVNPAYHELIINDIGTSISYTVCTADVIVNFPDSLGPVIISIYFKNFVLNMVL